MVENDPTSGISLIGYAVGTAFSWLGGYVCARVAQETELRCAAVVATISAATALAMGSELPLPLHLLLALLTVAAVMLGGWMGAQRNARQA
jgi:ABC-type antimicrobial peptide transport system permease subunit